MSHRTVRAAWIALAALQGGWPAKVEIGALRTVTVTPRGGGHPEQWSLSAGHKGGFTPPGVTI